MNTKKLSFIGSAGVGKTTLIKLLTEQVIPKSHNPTIGLDFDKLEFGSFKISLWELGGQKQFQFMWNDFIKGSNFICVVSDSSENNITETKKIIDDFKLLRDKMLVIANQQDKNNALSPTEIQERLGVETIPMIAIDESKKQELLSIIEEKMNSI